MNIPDVIQPDRLKSDDSIALLEGRIQKLENQQKKFNLLFVLVSFIFIVAGTLTGLGILKISDLTNHIIKFIYTPSFIYKEISDNEDINFDVKNFADKDTDIHEDLLAIFREKWDLKHYNDFVTKTDVEGSAISHLYTALHTHHGGRINTLLTEEPATLANHKIFNRKFAGTTISKVKIELMGEQEYGSPDKCGGPNIKKTDRVIIFVRSQSPTDKEKILDCPGYSRPVIYVELATARGLEGDYQVIGINEDNNNSTIPIVRVTEKVAEELGFTEKPINPFSIEGSLIISRGAPL